MKNRLMAQPRFHSVLSVVALFITLCAASPPAKVELPELEGVRITFSHLGSSPDLGQLRMAETGERKYSTRPGDDYWLRLENHSPVLISFPTQSMYIPKPAEWAEAGPGPKIFALAENSEVAVLFDSFEGLYRYGTMSSIAYLPAGRSILFSVPKRFLEKDRSISIEVTAYPPEVIAAAEKPRTYAVRFAASELPKK